MAAPWEEYQTQATAEPWKDYQPTEKQAPKKEAFSLKGEGYDRMVNYSPRDAIGGQIRGASSIGSTLIRPFESGSENDQRRKSIDEGLTSLIGSNPKSMGYQTNKLMAEVMGTAGIGGAAANLLARIPGLATAAPGLLQAIRSGGMTTGAPAATGFGAQVANMGTRVAGGALNGTLTAGAVNPEDARLGAALGGAMPVVAKTLGAAGSLAGDLMRNKSPNPVLQQTIDNSIGAGYVIPPNMVQPNLKNQIIESISGKQATQQIASTKNTEVTEGLVRNALGIAGDVPLSQTTLENLRKTAGRTYGEVSALSTQAAADLEALKVARNEASGLFKFYNRSGDPRVLTEAKQARAMSDSLETALEGHANTANRPDLIPDLREARKQIAKTYTVGRALNDASGTVDARVFGRMSEKGLPLSDGLDVAGKFASAFPTIAKSPQQVGSPAAHNLKAIGSMLMAGSGYAALGPFGVAAAALPFVAPPLARSAMFRNGAQQGLLSQPAGQGLLGSMVDDALPAYYRLNPLLAGNFNGQ